MSEELLRLNKYIAENTEYSRRSADELILEGKVCVNGKIIKELGTKISEKDKVSISGQELKKKNYEYYIFHKPAGFITTKSDEKSRKTIYDILPENFRLLNPCGRLDKASSGLLIMTNDGELLQNLTHPKIQVSKIYRVSIKGKLSEGDIYKLENGIEIEKGKTAYAEVELIDFEKGISVLKITLYQGYNRQIRKMMEKLGKEVVALKRISHGTITLQGLEKGQYRKITKNELYNLNTYLNKKLKILKKVKEKK